jgi:hypothetical protein
VAADHRRFPIGGAPELTGVSRLEAGGTADYKSALQLCHSRRLNHSDAPLGIDIPGRGPFSFSEAAFRVVRTSVYAGLAVPTEASLVVSNRGPHGLFLADIEWLSVNKISKQRRAVWQPPIAGNPTLTVDARFDAEGGPQGGMTYLATQWLSKAQVENTRRWKAYSRQLAARQEFRRTVQQRSGWFAPVLAMLVVAPLIVVMWKRLRHTRPHT